jgi:Na+-driven multidrug efflux pump
MIMMTSLQAMGKALPALIVSLSRQGIMYIPAILILNSLFEFNGLVFAMPIADLLTTILSSTMLIIILKKLKEQTGAEQSAINRASVAPKPDNA